MTIKKKFLSDGRTLLKDSSGQEYVVPAGIRVSDALGEGFESSVRQAVDAKLNDARARFVISALFAPKAGGFKINYTLTESVNVRISTLRSEPIGWAVFDRKEGALVEAMALIAPKYRRLGIYTALLKLLKLEVNSIILSDQKLSVENALRWMKQGTFDERYKRYRLNPGRRGSARKPTRRAIEQAIRAIYTRDATR